MIDLEPLVAVMRALRDLGSTNPLHHATDGEKALTFLRDPASPRPMLILLDLNMPRMSGTEFLAVIKADEVLRSIPVVVLTTSKEDRDRLRAFGLVPPATWSNPSTTRSSST